MDDFVHDTMSRRLTISCDDCSMRRTSACSDCVVTFLLHGDDQHDAPTVPVELDDDQARVVRLLGKAGLVPALRYHHAS